MGLPQNRVETTAEIADTNVMKKKTSAPLRDTDFVATHGIALIALVWCVLRAWQWVFVPVSPQQDALVYFNDASAWLRGLKPYVQFPLEYPPGALPVWIVPRWFTDDFQTFRKAYAAWMLCFDAATLALVWRAARLAGVGKRAQVGAGLLYAVGTAALGSLLLQRYDSVLGFAIMAWWVAAQQPRTRWLADCMIAVGIWVKLMAALVVPVYALFLWFDTPPRQRKSQLAKRAACLAGGTAILFLPFYMQAGDKLASFFQYHRDRGVQLETAYASFFLLLKPILPNVVNVAAQYGAIEIMHPWAATFARLAGWLTVGALLFTVVRFAQRFRDAQHSTRQSLLLEGAVAMLMGFMAFNKVTSPQYLLWLAPLAAVLAQQGSGARHAWRLAALSVVFVGTGLTWLFYYPQLFAMERWPSVVMAVRNLALGALWVSLLWPAWPRMERRWQAWSTPAATGKVALTAAALLAAWAFCVNLSPTPGDDVWLRLAEGESIIRQHQLGTFGVAENHLVVPHAWVASALLYVITQAFGHAAISWLGAVLACLTLACMVASAPRSGSLGFTRLAALAMAAYVVFLRTLNWPDAISLLLVAALVWILENWRAGGRAWAALPLLQLLWINTDPQAVAGPVLVAVLAGVTRATQPSKRASALRLLGAAGAMGLATCINPDGWAVLGRTDVLFGNPYARAWLWQWASPFGQSIWLYWPWLFVALLMFTALGLAARVGQRPWADGAQVLFAVAFAYQASTWVGLAVIVVWPALVRGLEACLALCALQGNQRSGLGAWAANALAGLLLVNAITYGYGVSDGEHRVPLRDGMGGDLPYGAMDTLRALRVQGLVFNELTDGALVMNKLAPQLRPVIDSRIELYSAEALQQYQAAYSDPRALQPFLEHYHVNAVLLHRARATAPVMQWLAQDPHWVKVGDVDNRTLFVRQS